MDSANTTKNANNDRPSGNARRFGWKWQLTRLLFISGLVITLATAVRPLASVWWLADLFCQFAVQYVLLLIPIVALLAVLGQRKSVLVFGLVLITNVFVIWPYAGPLIGLGGSSAGLPGDRDVGSGARLRLMTQNVLTSNRNYQKLIDLVELEKPDFLVLIEIDPMWIEGMRPIFKDYPYRQTKVHPGNFGIGILAKIPFQDCVTRELGPDRLPTLTADFVHQGKPFQIIGTHPVPPLGARQSESRNKTLLEVVQSFESDVPRILTGDFNLTPWSPWFSKVLAIGELSDSAIGHNIAASWFAFPTILGGVKIDHALVSDMRVLDHRIGPDVESDHRAVILDFVLSTD